MAQAKKIEKGVHSVRLAKARDGVDFEKVYEIDEAVAVIKKAATAKFDESIDISLRLGIDTKQTDQNVRGVVSLPNGTGKTVKIAVFAKDEKAEEAKKAGATLIGAEDLIEEVKKGNIDFDRCIATPDMMPLISQVAKVLGPKGLMPNPKLGTVTQDIASAVKDALAGQVEFRAEKGGIIHAIIGKKSFDDAKLIENLKSLINAINKAKPSSSKGTYLQKLSLSSTMGPSVKVSVASVTN